MTVLEQWLDEARTLLGGLNRFGAVTGWRFKQGDITGAELPEVDESTWSQPERPEWSLAAGSAAFRKSIKLPPVIEGIDTVGAEIGLNFIIVTPLEVFVDGRKVAQYRFWADTRPAALIIAEAYDPAKPVTVVFKIPQGDGYGYLNVSLSIDKVEKAKLILSAAIEQLKFARLLANTYQDQTLLDGLKKAESVLDIDALKARDWQRINASLDAIDMALEVFRPLAKQHEVHLIAHAHIDMNWLWSMDDTIDTCIRDFTTVNQLMDENPDLCFSQSQAAVYDIVKQYKPELIDKVKERIKEGRWDVTAATWVEGDINMASGEAIARQILYAGKYVEQVLDTHPSQICWEPDTFGHPISMPSILAKSGIKYYYFMRCGKGYPIFWWEGKDGSRVLAFNSPYGAEIRPSAVVSVAEQFLKDYGMKTSMFVYGVGDHGGGPTRYDIAVMRFLTQKPAMPKLIFSTTHRFYEEALKIKQDYPLVKDELNFIFEGCYTTHSDIKRYNRLLENKLTAAETMSVLSRMLGGGYPQQSLEKAWRDVCFNQFHDIFDGSGIHVTYEYSDKLAEDALAVAQEAIVSAAKHLASMIHTEGPGQPLVVYNTLGWNRDDVVVVELQGDDKGMLVDDTGATVPCQIEDGKLVFVARDIPALGYKVYRWFSGQEEVEFSKNSALESQRYSMQIAPQTGTIVRLYDKKTGRDILQPLIGTAEVPYAFWAEKSGNLFQVLTEEPHSMSAWIIGNINKAEYLIQPPQIEVEHIGPVRTVFRISRKYKSSTLIQRIMLYDDFDRIDFEADIDWQEKGSVQDGIPMLRVSFTTALDHPVYTYEIPFGWIERDVQGRELPSQRWIDLRSDDYGVCLLNDCKYGFSVQGNAVNMTLVRSSYEPDALPDIGRQIVRYALYPHDGRWCKSDAIRQGAGFNQPLVAIWEDTHEGHMKSANGFIKPLPDNLVLSAIKKAEDSDDIIIRFYETEGQRIKAKVEPIFDFKAAFEADIHERPLRPLDNDGRIIIMDVQPYEIKTLRIQI